MMKNKIKTTVLALLLAASVAACKKKGGDSGGGGGIGVPECDDYFARMDACSKKIDKTRGDSLTRMVNMMKPAWKEEAADAEKKKNLPGVCKTAVKDMAKQVPECDWGVAPEPTGSGSAGSADTTGSGSAAPEGSGSAGSGSAAAPEGSAGSGSAAAPAGSGSATP